MMLGSSILYVTGSLASNDVLSKRVKRTLVDGFTDNVYRYKKTGKYIDLIYDGFEHLIVSFEKV